MTLGVYVCMRVCVRALGEWHSEGGTEGKLLRRAQERVAERAGLKFYSRPVRPHGVCGVLEELREYICIRLYDHFFSAVLPPAEREKKLVFGAR